VFNTRYLCACEIGTLVMLRWFVCCRRLELRYPHYPSERDFTHSVLSSGDIRNQAQGGDLYLLARFAQEWPRLQAGGMLLPDLVEFYQWLHTALGELNHTSEIFEV